MPLTAETQAVLKMREGLPPSHTLTPEEARRQSDAMRVKGEVEPVARVEDRTIPGPAGEIPVRVYSARADAALPTLVYFHGGGWVVGDLDSHDNVCRALANRSGCSVVSIHYRRAPEAEYPAAADDCYAAAAWVAEHAAEVGGDGRIAVGGDSAGGNLAAVVSQMARERGGPQIAAQILIYPVTDFNFETESYRVNGDGSYGLSEAGMRWYWGLYAPDEARAVEPYASPLRAGDLSNLPPALVQTAEYDALRDEGEAYGAALEAAGCTVCTTRYDGVIHGFVSMFAAVPEGSAALDEIAECLRAAFAGECG